MPNSLYVGQVSEGVSKGKENADATLTSSPMKEAPLVFRMSTTAEAIMSM